MPKHHKHTVKKWRIVTQNIENSDLSTSEYCKQNNISVKTFYAWKTKLRKLDSNESGIKSHFQELKLKEPEIKPSSIPTSSRTIDIFLNDKIRISLADDFNESLLLKTIKVLNKAVC